MCVCVHARKDMQRTIAKFVLLIIILVWLEGFFSEAEAKELATGMKD